MNFASGKGELSIVGKLKMVKNHAHRSGQHSHPGDISILLTEHAHMVELW